MQMSKLQRYVIGPVRYFVSTAIMVMSAPNYFILWAGWRGISLILPGWMYQVGDDFLYSMYQRLVLFFFEHCTHVKIYFSGDFDMVLERKEKALYIANHQSTVDWVVCNMLAVRQGSIGHLRYVMKDTLQMLPLYGHYFYQHGCIYIKRDQFKQHKMESVLKYLTHRKINSWIVIFPEGTRFIPEQKDLIEKSGKAAQDSGFTPLTNHLTPRTRGTYIALSHLKDNIDAIYDVAVIYSGTIDSRGNRTKAPQLIDFLFGKSPEMHIHVTRIPINEVPLEEAGFKHWMYNRFVEKDKFVKQYYDEAERLSKLDLSRNGILHKLPLYATAPSFVFFMGCFVPLFVSETWRSIFWRFLVAGVPLSYAWLGIKAVC